ncbi:MAG: hypothetical protein QXS37_06600 [Candidatus Aenigmatarchaeota archaeon]
MGKKFLFILIVVVAIFLLLYFSGIVERFAISTQPVEVEFDKWNLYIILNIVWALFFSLLIFYLYSTRLYRLVRINNFQDVFKLIQSWWIGFVIVGVITLVFSFFFGIAFVPKKSFKLFINIFFLSVSISLLGVFFYWIFTLLYSPPKVKYVPLLRYELIKMIKKIKGR